MKIGFIDYYLDEWHANNYPVWIRDSGRNLMPDGTKKFEIAHAWAAKDREGGLTSRQWCEKFGVQHAASLETLVTDCDCLIVLSPDHPEQHEALARLALMSGKPTYVDKTFAPDKVTAERMFGLAEKHGTPLYSTSALRYAGELDKIRAAGLTQEQVSFVSTRGPGVLANYGVHQVEMVAAAMGTGAERVLMQGPAESPTYLIAYAGGRTAVVQHLPWIDFSILVQGNPANSAKPAVNPSPETVTVEESKQEAMGLLQEIALDFWTPFIDDMLRFFETGISSVPKKETLEVMALIEAGAKAMRQPGVWVDLNR